MARVITVTITDNRNLEPPPLSAPQVDPSVDRIRNAVADSFFGSHEEPFNLGIDIVFAREDGSEVVFEGRTDSLTEGVK